TAPREDGRPGSVTLLARSGQDALTASVARQFEFNCQRKLGATDHDASGIIALSNPAKSERMELAVCGAHMADLPLNWQLTGRGGAFLRTAKTSANYKFYALAGGPPERPGLVRTGDVDAQSIALEIWSLPLDQVGGFLAGIPAPLGLGSVELEDGHLVKGFICEASGTAGARDISEFGDWRTYLSSSS
ncbi:MAG: allophanate hydrolase, partial [Hyphomicrobiales bacterium]